MKTTTDAARVNGTTLVYAVAGPVDGTPVVFSHSLFMGYEMMYPLMDHFADRGYRTYAYDHRGQGSSAPAQRNELDLRTLTADAAAFIQHLGLRRPHVVGNSLGGMVALRLAAWHPDLVGSVAALGSSAEAEYRRPEFDPLVDHLTAHGMKGDLETEQGPIPVLDVVTNIMFGDYTLAHNHELTRTWVARFEQLQRSIGDAAFGVVDRDSVVDDLNGCTVPVLAIAGAEDHAYPQPISGKNIAEAAGGRHVTIDNAGHSVALEQPELVAPHLEEHFALAEAS